jgi:hypothetical protein
MQTNKLWGALILTLAVTIAVIGLVDAGVFIGWGLQSTLSQHIADALHNNGGVFVFFIGAAFVAGMLATHFTGFGMEHSDVVALKKRIAELESKLGELDA